MKKLLRTLPFAVATALCTLAVQANAQAPTVAINGIGSSALFLESGLAASNTSGTSPIGASCVWTGNNTAALSNVVSATDTSAPVGPLADTGNAWVAWTPVAGSCTAITSTSPTTIYAYLQTDSVVGDRCLFNAHLSPSKCGITYPTGVPTSAGLLYPTNDATRSETALPLAIANALNAATVNAAGTDIRPEDAWFATKRAMVACGSPVATGSQYLGLGYNNGDNITSSFSSSVFHVIDFTLPSGYAVTPVGATPILVVVNGQNSTSGFGTRTFTNISSANLAKFLNGTFTLTGQVNGVDSGNPVTTLIREPLSGTFNTMEYNVPNRTASGFQTSQEAGNCPIVNPLTGSRKRAIGTGQELSQVIAAANNDVIGYGFWSVANFAGFTSAAAPNARYLTVDGVDPLITASAGHTGIIPLSGTSDMANVTLANINNASVNYPIWSLLRFVTLSSDTTGTASAQTLATAAQHFVNFNTNTSRPDFITATNISVVRSHFLPPAPAGQPTAIANGHVGNVPTSNCTNPEVGGDVGGVVLTLGADSTTCRSQPTGMKTGTIGSRR
ncbi:hypothetical protein [Granulicella sp. dw_53]|uniref:hypothetical protein n=1 Tax=Granulicella sp. dw_53 TaxID=2719792 RepID=UPI001BD689B8|nr:hypothetical protein [Granulicella sp. dw_53]